MLGLLPLLLSLPLRLLLRCWRLLAVAIWLLLRLLLAWLLLLLTLGFRAITRLPLLCCSRDPDAGRPTIGTTRLLLLC